MNTFTTLLTFIKQLLAKVAMFIPKVEHYWAILKGKYLTASSVVANLTPMSGHDVIIGYMEYPPIQDCISILYPMHHANHDLATITIYKDGVVDSRTFSEGDIISYQGINGMIHVELVRDTHALVAVAERPIKYDDILIELQPSVITPEDNLYNVVVHYHGTNVTLISDI